MPFPALFAKDGPLLAGVAIGALAGIYCFWKGCRILLRRRLLLDTPVSSIRSTPMGLVELSGSATGPYVVSSPIGQVDCYFHRTIAWKLDQRGKNSQWVKVAEETLHVPFYIDDGSDKVLLDPRGAELDLPCDLQEQYNRSSVFGASEVPNHVAEFLSRHGADPEKHIKVEEYCIKPEDSVFVLGTLSQNPGLDASVMPAWAERRGAKQSAPASEPAGETASAEIIRLSRVEATVPATQMTQQQKIAAALMKAGVANPAGWSMGPGAAKTTVPELPRVDAVTVKPEKQESPAEISEGYDLHPPVVLMKGTHERAFFIACKSQRELARSGGWKSALMISGGSVLILASTYLLITHFSRL